jgi:Domain of unknown function (DUF6458)
MKIGSGLALICIGAILAFAVTANTSAFNLHTAGWVLMLIGVIGLVLPGRTAGWLGRRVLVRRTYPGRRVERVPVQSYVAGTPGDPVTRPGLPSRPTLLDQEDDLIEEARPGYDVVQETESTGYRPTAGQARPAAPRPGAKSTVTEVVEDLYEEP